MCSCQSQYAKYFLVQNVLHEIYMNLHTGEREREEKNVLLEEFSTLSLLCSRLFTCTQIYFFSILIIYCMECNIHRRHYRHIRRMLIDDYTNIRNNLRMCTHVNSVWKWIKKTLRRWSRKNGSLCWRVTYLSTGDANDGGDGDVAAVFNVLNALIQRLLILVVAEFDDDDALRLDESPWPLLLVTPPGPLTVLTVDPSESPCNSRSFIKYKSNWNDNNFIHFSVTWWYV